MAEGVSAIAGSLVDAPEYRVPLNEEEAPSGELGKDAFLKLLVAQLKYQDPLEPSSSEDFIATTAQFTVVEKLDELTKQGENTQLVNSLTTASTLIGREVTASQGDGITITAVVNESRIVGGQVSLQTDQGPIGLDEIVSVGAAPVPQAPLLVSPGQTETTTETSNDTGAETSNQSEAGAVDPAESVDPDATRPRLTHWPQLSTRQSLPIRLLLASRLYRAKPAPTTRKRTAILAPVAVCFSRVIRTRSSIPNPRPSLNH